MNQALLVALGMFGSARAIRTNGHTEFTMLSNKIKSRNARVIVRGIFLAITIGFLIFLLVNSYDYTMRGRMLSTVLRVRRMYYYMSIPIGFALMIYEYCRAAKRRVFDDPVQSEE